MEFQDVIFWVLAVASVLAALGVVLLKDIFRAALLLVVVFLAVAGFFVMMNAEFLAVIQVLIYAGAIAILIIFAIMLTREVQRGNLPNRLQPAAVLFPSLLLAALVFVAMDTDWNLLSDEPEKLRNNAELLQSNTIGGMPDEWRQGLEKEIEEANTRVEELRQAGQVEEAEQSELARDTAVKELASGERSGIGDLLVNDFVLPFEVAAVLLLAAIIGSLVLVREREN